MWKVSKYGVFYGPYFPVFELNTENYGLNHLIESEFEKNGPRKTSYLDGFPSVGINLWHSTGTNSHCYGISDTGAVLQRCSIKIRCF